MIGDSQQSKVKVVLILKESGVAEGAEPDLRYCTRHSSIVSHDPTYNQPSESMVFERQPNIPTQGC
jgi:hypothetical protein